jgi:two-component system, sporulation sensor kinase E
VRKFIQKALERLERLDREQIAHLIAGLSEENELFAGVLESMTDGIVVTDPAHRVILSNRAAARMLGIVSDDAAERPLGEAVADRALAAFLDENLAGPAKVADREFTLDGGRRLLSVSILPLVREGRVQGALVHVEDVTGRRAREARLRRAESLASLTTLAAGVAHEIKNPLGSMGIHLQLIRRKTGGRESVDARELEPHLAVLAEEVDRLNRIVVDFLFAVKPMDARLEDADLNAVVRDLIAFVRPEMEQAGVTVESDLADDLPALKLDVRYIRQALLNLIKNAVAAMGGGGRLRLETQRRGGEVQVRVIDTGSGIPAEILDKIFEPYFTTKPFGTGLGLTIVFKIVKEHFGDIAVASREGEGTAFTITLPVPQTDTMLIEDRRGAR